MTKKTKRTERSDGWANVLTSIGSIKDDRISGYSYNQGLVVGRKTIDNIYRSDGIGKRIVDLIPNEMTRQWITVQGDSNNDIIGTLDAIGAKKKINELLKWSRLYGGAVAIMGIDDGQELSMPVQEQAIRTIDFIHVFDRFQVSWNYAHLYSDPNNKKFGMPEYYSISPYHGGAPFLVHETRVLRVDGEALPNRLKNLNQQWGDTVFQSVYYQLRDLGVVYGAANNIIQDFIQTVLSIDNLTEMLENDNDDLITKRLNIIDKSRSVANTIILDSNEKYSKQASSVAGLDGLIDRFAQNLCAVSGVPFTLLMGQSPAGLNATGDSDIRFFYDMIKSKQEDELQPLLERLVRLVMISRDGPFKGKELDNWKIEFNPLWQASDAENAAYRKLVAETDQIYINTGVLDPEEVAISRFGGDVYSDETEIDLASRSETSYSEEATKELEREQAEAKAAEAQAALLEKMQKMQAQLDSRADEKQHQEQMMNILNKLAE